MSMKTKACKILISLSAALVTLSAHAAPAAAMPPEPRDSVVEKATLSLIESVESLSRTASQLSEVVSRWNDEESNQQRRDSRVKRPAKKEAASQHPEYRSEIAETESIEETPAERGNGVFIGETIDRATYGSTTGTTTAAEIRETIVYIEPEAREGGSYLWVPDSLAGNVEAVMSGKTFGDIAVSTGNPGGDPFEPDLTEMVNWRGTKIPMALHTKRLGRYDRKLYNWLIYPKGLWHIGLTANYGELDTENSELLSLMKEIDIKGKIYSIKPSVSYFIRNNACVGIRLAFTKGDLGINSFKVDIDEDMNFNLHDIKYTSDSYSAAVFFQQYFGLSRRGRFAVFNEAELSAGSGSTHFIRPFDGATRDTRTKTQSVNLNYSPGVSIMMMKNAAFNLSFGIFGFHLKTEKQWENGEECGTRTTSGINFRFNIFNINFGVAIII